MSDIHFWELGRDDDPFVEVCPQCKSIDLRENYQSTLGRPHCVMRCRKCKFEFIEPTLANFHEVEWELKELEQRDAEFARQIAEWRAYREAQRKVER